MYQFIKTNTKNTTGKIIMTGQVCLARGPLEVRRATHVTNEIGSIQSRLETPLIEKRG
jgi:hypothetical protein